MSPDLLLLRALDRAVQAFLRELDPTIPMELQVVAALASYQVGQGHACIDLDDEAVRSACAGFALGSSAELSARLLRSPLVTADPARSRPDALFVLDGQRFYLRRFWDCERSLIERIALRLQCGFADPQPLRGWLDQLFGHADAAALDWQRVACAVAAGSRFAIVTGGPGTGKTTTVVRMLGLLQARALHEGGNPLRICLAAPTGKAAARLGAAVAGQIAALPLDAAVRERIPAEVVTVHRLLGRRWDSRQPRHDAGNPLPLDVLVVDEASMLDLEMTADLLAALPDSAQLILLGDRDQLASVEAGSVFGDLCRHAAEARYHADTCEWIGAASGAALRPSAVPGSVLEQHQVMLQYSHRFAGGSGIGQLARAVNAGDAKAFHDVLAAGLTDIEWQAQRSPAAFTVSAYASYLHALQASRPRTEADEAAWLAWARDALARLGRFQLLAATRDGPRGVDGLNAAVAQGLVRAGLVDPGSAWYEGRPVMITRNDFALGLMNGDVGVVLRMPAAAVGSSALRAVFATPALGEGELRAVSPARLAAVDDAYAITVHKSQGSEFDQVALVLPAEDSPVLSRELLYTAITRARQRFIGLGSLEVAERALARPTRRGSGLAL